MKVLLDEAIGAGLPGAANGAAGSGAAGASGEPGAGSSGAGEAGPSFAAELFTPELLDAESRAWATKQGFVTDKGMSPATAAKLMKEAHEKEKLIGSSIRVPGKDATPEERKAFLDKLGRPAEAAGYEFKQPADLPEDLPYDGEFATAFKAFAHEQGFTKAQAEAAHDWYISNLVKTHNGATESAAARTTENAKTATAALEKLWGPLDGATAKANLDLGNKVLVEIGSAEITSELQRFGLVAADGKTILSPAIAVLFGNIGASLYREGDMVKGNPSQVGNVFADGESNNMTEQMRIIREDRDLALSLIQAAGKQPATFGLKV